LVGSPEGDMLYFWLENNSGSTWNLVDGPWWGEFSLDSTNTHAPSPGWYTLKVRSDGPWSGTWAAYATSTNVDFSNSIQTPDNLTFDLATGDKFFRLSQYNVYNYQSYFVQTDCSKDIVIEEDEGSLDEVYWYDEFGSWVVSFETDSDGNRRITTNDCEELLELEFSPSTESRIKFGISLEPDNVSVVDNADSIGSCYYEAVNVDGNTGQWRVWESGTSDANGDLPLFVYDNWYSRWQHNGGETTCSATDHPVLTFEEALSCLNTYCSNADVFSLNQSNPFVEGPAQ